jgi:hypothetical protein
MRTLFGGLALTIVLAAPAAAQSSSSPLADALRANLKTSERNFVAAVDLMPADKFGFKPTPQQSSFGHLVVHAINANKFMCALVSGQQAPKGTPVTDSTPKAELLTQLKDSYSFCNSALSSLNDSDLNAQLPFFGGRKISRAGAEVDLANDWTDHYTQAAGYLRLSGILPPTARGRSAE